MSTTVELDTVPQVTERIDQVIADAPRATKKERRIRAALLADLYEIRRRLIWKRGHRARLDDHDDEFGLICSIASAKDQDRAVYWREIAGSRNP